MLKQTKFVHKSFLFKNICLFLKVNYTFKKEQ